MAEVFDNIRAECARRRMSLSEMTETIGIERKTFYNWENKGDLPVSVLSKIADVLNVSTDKLLGLSGKE
ncbi:MAG: helix-turn-helix transcriptional regulator [Clostridia bacterium]|nr:helix-turn-helix transcriptional regulator [Clostridia bacterium]MBQ2429109.1 helix-turn-helix transcriptional regulator [Ruminococcus sp.]